jgi:hypothetical protein
LRSNPRTLLDDGSIDVNKAEPGQIDLPDQNVNATGPGLNGTTGLNGTGLNGTGLNGTNSTSKNGTKEKAVGGADVSVPSHIYTALAMIFAIIFAA